MSSIDPLATAASALLATTQQIGVVAQNIGNSQNQSYAVRAANVVPVVPEDGGGAQVVSVTRAVNTALQNGLIGDTATAGLTGYVSSLYTQLESLTGSSTGTPTLTSAVNNLVTAFQAFQSEPESQATQGQVVTAAQNMVARIRAISSGIAKAQTQIQSDATSDVATLNGDLAQFQKLNAAIVAAGPGSTATANLQDQRDQLLTQIANLVPLRQQQNADGSVSLYTPDGVSLVDSGAASFSYDPASNTLYVSNDPSQTSLNLSFNSGRIGAELDALRTDAAAVQSTDPGMAPLEKLREQLNAFADLFYAAPPAAATALQSAYDTATPVNAGELATGLFTFSGPSTVPNDDRDLLQVNPALANGTATLKQSAGQAVANQLTATNTSFAGGNLNLANASYAQIANAIAADQSGRASTATSDAQTATTNLSTVTTSYSGQTGVSMDQQLSLLIVLQNAYNAAAKIISTVGQLEQTLISSVQ